MKKTILMFVCAMMISMAFCGCGQCSKATSDADSIACDSIEIVDTLAIDTVVVDSIMADTVAIDSVDAE